MTSWPQKCCCHVLNLWGWKFWYLFLEISYTIIVRLEAQWYVGGFMMHWCPLWCSFNVGQIPISFISLQQNLLLSWVLPSRRFQDLRFDQYRTQINMDKFICNENGISPSHKEDNSVILDGNQRVKLLNSSDIQRYLVMTLTPSPRIGSLWAHP